MPWVLKGVAMLPCIERDEPAGAAELWELDFDDHRAWRLHRRALVFHSCATS